GAMAPRAGMTGGAGMGTAQQAGSGGAAGSSAAGSAAAAGAGGAAGAAGAPPSSGGAGGSSGTMPKQALPPVTDYTQKGPFKTTMTSNTGPENKFTIFRPEPLGMDGFVHSPIIFGPGIITTPSNYRTFLDHLASHGFVTICANSLTGGPNDPGNLKAMQTGLDWLIEQNGQSGVFQGKLAVDRAITMGYSIGSTASIQLSNHKAVMTTVAIHGHNTKGDPHGPVLLLTGTEDVINDVRMTLTTLEEAPAVLMALPIGHLDVLGELAAGGRYVGPITAWLRFWVNGDTAAKSFFWGSDCKMCASPWITPEANAKWKAQML
ncbi:MAG TPA: hypothetical protein VJV78_00230, partial [Polyangiales bacterium]|nr:hypothetical protein [Polyangiales bacterium]